MEKTHMTDNDHVALGAFLSSITMGDIAYNASEPMVNIAVAINHYLKDNVDEGKVNDRYLADTREYIEAKKMAIVNRMELDFLRKELNDNR